MMIKNINPGKTKLWLLLLVIVVSAFIIWISVDTLSARSNTKSYDSQELRELERELAQTTDPEARQLIEAKIAILQKLLDEQNLAVSTYVAKPDDPCEQRPDDPENPDAQRRIGIFEGPTPFRSTDIVLNNQWQEKINGFWVHVYAGSLFDNRDQGVIIVSVEGMKMGGRYLTPSQSGMVKITSASGYRLILETEDGTVYYFDVPAQAFVESMDEIVPTLTPAPTYTPTISPCLEASSTEPATPYP
jgi:hypothetical protein